LTFGCGLASRDYTLTQPFTAGGGAPTSASFNSAQLLAPLSADVSSVSSVQLTGASIQSLDSGDLALIQNISIVASGNGVAQTTLASYSGPPPAGTTSLPLTLGANTDLKPYLQAGGLVSASVQYVNFPATARSLQLTLTVRGSLL
jgi:hypothetical protein